jgi:hypothetical protein
MVKEKKKNIQSIKIDPWPKIIALENNSWKRIWTIFLKDAIPLDISLDALSVEISREVIEYISKYFAKEYKWHYLNEQDFKVILEKRSDKEIIANVITGIYSNYDPFLVFAPLWLFVNIERKLGCIDKFEINGTIYDKWQPWINRKLYLGDTYF